MHPEIAYRLKGSRNNTFSDAPASGVAITIGSDVEYTRVYDNRGTSQNGYTNGGTIVDDGTGTQLRPNDAEAAIYQGTGDPNGAVKAAMGSLYLRIDTGQVYLKTYGNFTQATTWTELAVVT